jgi:branched-chain amino acid transport system ATP-binding protein
MSERTDRTAPAPDLLRVEAVEAAYGPFRALFGVSFRVAAGSAVALVGPNGAGKTTVARVCSGLVKPTAGRLLLDGEEVTGQSAQWLAGKGIAHAPEGRSVFATLTVEENLVLAFRASLGRSAVRGSLDHAYEMFPRLGDRRRQLAGSLSGGEQRMLTMARVLVLQPRLLIADELSLGLAPVVTQEVYRQLEQVRAAGTALLIVEQHLDHALELADEVVVLDSGETRFAGPVSELGDHAAGFLSVDGGGSAPAPARRPARRRRQPLRAQRTARRETAE